MEDNMEDFDFSSDLRDQVEDALVERVTRAIFDDGGKMAADIIRYGYLGVEGMSAQELMDEYINWHGLYDLDQDISTVDDPLVQKMLKEVADAKFEAEVLTKDLDPTHSDTSNCSNSLSDG